MICYKWETLKGLLSSFISFKYWKYHGGRLKLKMIYQTPAHWVPLPSAFCTTKIACNLYCHTIFLKLSLNFFNFLHSFKSLNLDWIPISIPKYDITIITYRIYPFDRIMKIRLYKAIVGMVFYRRPCCIYHKIDGPPNQEVLYWS